MMYSVRIDKDGDGYVFKVQPIERGIEMIALDSTPGVIAFIEAEDPGRACQSAWYRALHMHDDRPELPSFDDLGKYLGSLK